MFAALNTLDGHVLAQYQQHRHGEWLKPLCQINSETPKEKDLHLVCDNYIEIFVYMTIG
ncbi:hypothetical protein AGMMS50256_30510 [Betaproteobacteria bacterium]|nr:hypothetical protein AGMMS50256_30510 [Betaproteobacteria bacterium]